MSPTEVENGERKEYFSAYNEYNKILRTWFVTFGIGGPLLLLANPEITKTLISKASLRPVVIAFLIGCAAQILNAVLNKAGSWYGYAYSNEKAIQPNGLIRWLIRTQKIYWIDAAADLITVFVFGYAIVRLLLALVP